MCIDLCKKRSEQVRFTRRNNCGTMHLGKLQRQVSG